MSKAYRYTSVRTDSTGAAVWAHAHCAYLTQNNTGNKSWNKIRCFAQSNTENNTDNNTDTIAWNNTYIIARNIAGILSGISPEIERRHDIRDSRNSFGSPVGAFRHEKGTRCRGVPSPRRAGTVSESGTYGTHAREPHKPAVSRFYWGSRWIIFPETKVSQTGRNEAEIKTGIFCGIPPALFPQRFSGSVSGCLPGPGGTFKGQDVGECRLPGAGSPAGTPSAAAA